MAVRNTVAGKDIKEAIHKEIKNAKLDVMELDLSLMAPVMNFSSNYKYLSLPQNLLINNAGVMATPFLKSKDNIEFQFATNLLGHFLLIHLMLDTMKSTASERNIERRVIIVSSEGNRFAYKGIYFNKIHDEASYNSIYAYEQSKLTNILHADDLARQVKEEGSNITANSLHPGSIMANLLRYHNILNKTGNMFGRYMLKSIPQGATTTFYVALHLQIKGVRGEYYAYCNTSNRSSLVKDTELAKKLRDYSLNLMNS